MFEPFGFVPPVTGPDPRDAEIRRLRAEIELLGEVADVCTFKTLGKVCSYCQCDRGSAAND